MNLIFHPWLKAVNTQGIIANITPIEIIDPQWIDLWAPRPDFKGALYQFLIGLLQTSFAPNRLSNWQELWNSPPDTDTLLRDFSVYKHAFELKNLDGPAFMQDFALEDGEKCHIASLLIESPGEVTIKENRDLFIKRDQYEKICPACAAMALFTLQLNAPSGGRGHRVGLRGGGPLTTLVLPDDPHANLWQRLWLNVFAENEKIYTQTFHPTDQVAEADIFPWLAPTRTSEKSAAITCPEDTHPLQVYWAMPRRIRFCFDKTTMGYCDLCGEKNDELISSYHTKNYGINYSGSWVHPLTPYRHELKNNAPPLSVKGQMGGIGYRHWLGLALGNEERKEFPAAIVNSYYKKAEEFEELPRLILWCFGYDMKKMNARCWYENTLPLFPLEMEQHKCLQYEVGELLKTSREVLQQLKSAIKSAWFANSDQSKKFDSSFIEQQFWEKTENFFYTQCLDKIYKNISNENTIVSVFESWLKKITSLVNYLFDATVLSGPVEDMNIKKIIEERKNMRKWLYCAPALKSVRGRVKAHKLNFASPKILEKETV
jgi:CRISPR system Cascade subunit CasA